MIIKEELAEILKVKYKGYALETIKERSLPDLRDGLKPSQRRIILSLNDLNLYSNKPHKKSSKIIGDTLGSYHPKGDAALYEAMVRLTQPFINNHPLIEGQGNMGSLEDPKSFAALRYTEGRMTKICEHLVKELPYQNVKFKPNYDNTLSEPEVLPTVFPMYLLTAAFGIAVGYTTASPPYNLGEIADLLIAILKEKEKDHQFSGFSPKGILKYVPGPDFPVYNTIQSVGSGLQESVLTGTGSYVITGAYETSESSIVIKSLPFLEYKGNFFEKLSEQIKSQKIVGISGVEDNSAKSKMEIVIKVKRDASVSVVLNQLLKHTPLQKTMHTCYNSILNERPLLLGVQGVLLHWIKFRDTCVKKKHKFFSEKLKTQIELYSGVLKVKDITKAIKLIKESSSKVEAIQKMMSVYALNERQATFLVELQVYRFTKEHLDEFATKLKEMEKEYEFHLSFIKSRTKRFKEIREEVTSFKDTFAKPRLCEILPGSFSQSDEDERKYIEEAQNVIHLSNEGYLKRIPNEGNIKIQRRNGKGRKFKTKVEDHIVSSIPCSNHDEIYFISDRAKLYKLPAYKIPEAKSSTIGTHINGLINVESNEKITNIVNFPKLDNLEGHEFFIATKEGMVKKTPLQEYKNLRKSGLLACALRDNDSVVYSLVEAVSNIDNKLILMVNSHGFANLFPLSKINNTGRTTYGVKGMKIKTKNSEVVFTASVDKAEIDNYLVCTITKFGMGKLSPLKDFRITERNTRGVTAMAVAKKDSLFSCFLVNKLDLETYIVTLVSKQKIISIKLSELRTLGRITKGTRLMDMNEDDSLSSCFFSLID